MKKFIITISDMPESVMVAENCKKSASNFGQYDIYNWDATTPKDNPINILKNEGISDIGFKKASGRFESVISCFLSHYRLWQKCIELNEAIMILEHDAEFIDNNIPELHQFNHAISIGMPSWGTFNTPNIIGLNKLTSKKIFPGTHAYIIKPFAAKEFIKRAKIDAEATDKFLSLNRFTWLEEWYPWPVRANDTFTTIQTKEYLNSKHAYQTLGEKYQIKYFGES